jgi:hypothetical protein
MTYFIDRTEDNGTIKIIYKNAALYYYTMWGFFGTGALAWSYNELFYIPCGVCFIAMLIMALIYRKPNAEIRQAMKDGKIEAKGSKYSFENPLSYTITTTKI